MLQKRRAVLTVFTQPFQILRPTRPSLPRHAHRRQPPRLLPHLSLAKRPHLRHRPFGRRLQHRLARPGLLAARHRFTPRDLGQSLHLRWHGMVRHSLRLCHRHGPRLRSLDLLAFLSHFPRSTKRSTERLGSLQSRDRDCSLRKRRCRAYAPSALHGGHEFHLRGIDCRVFASDL